MGPEETLLPHRVLVIGVIGVLVMVAMRRGPPQSPALDAGAAQHRKNKLHEAGGAEGAVREIPVEETGDGEHPNEVEGDRREDGRPTPTGPDCTQAAQVQEEERKSADPFDLFGLFLQGQSAAGDEVGIHPLGHGYSDMSKSSDDDVIRHESQTVFSVSLRPVEFITRPTK